MKCYVAMVILINFLPSVMPIPHINGSCELETYKRILVKERTIINCRCQDDGTSEVLWESLMYGYLTEPFTDAILSLPLTRQYDGDDISCTGYNNTAVDTMPIFHVRVAYGPDNVSLVIDPSSSQVDVCPTCGHITIECIPDGYSPNMSTSIYTNGTRVHTGSVYILSKNITGGRLNITCVSQNSVYNDLTAANSSVILVRVPPVSPPVMTIDGRNSSTVTVPEGHRQITCHVDGGYPQVDNVTVQCGSLSYISVQGHVLTHSENITRNLQGSSCSCSASHVTGYYKLTTLVTLDVQYTPVVNNFTINDVSGPQNISNGTFVTIACLAEGNPKPTLNIVTSKGNLTLWTGVSPLNVTTEMICSDSPTSYMCVAKNSLGVSSRRSIDVSVLCVQAPPSSPSASPPASLLPIIVGVIVPVVVLAVIALVVVIICRKRSQWPQPTTPEQSSHPSPNFDITTHSGSHLSGSYNSIDSDARDTLNRYEDFQPTSSSDQSSIGVYNNVNLPSTSSNKTHVTGRHAKTRSEASGIEIIPVATGTAYGGEQINADPRNSESVPPIIPDKARHKAKQSRSSTKDDDPYDVLPVNDHNNIPILDGVRIPPVPKLKTALVNIKLRPVNQTEES